ncbi:ATP-binding cassette domain-containing protein [Herbidospora cretacea]|uniref:ATP-binding cassette domain-containing protein n=1 Tax=Herbidospora cretacea TaxID=28444 RepID=UPI00068BEA48|nr:ATP-binding cassette domain-containing protein [Herbidospora cretacea]
MKAVLEVTALSAGYGAARAIRAVTMRVEQGEHHAIVGGPGSGKTTLLRTLVGLHPAANGTIRFNDTDITRERPEWRKARGLCLMPQNHRLFTSLTVEENLLVGARWAAPGPWTLSKVYDLYPALREKRRARAAALSLTEHQAAAVGRALMANPRILLLDAPADLAALDRLTKEGLAVVAATREAPAGACHVHRLVDGTVTTTRTEVRCRR